MKDQIIQDAALLFLNQGFKTVTMDAIAKASGISKKTIYVHFKSKAALVKACVFHLQETIMSQIDVAFNSDLDPIEEFFAIKDLIIERLGKDQYAKQSELEIYFPEIHKQLIGSRFYKIVSWIRKNLEKGQALGLYRQNLDKDFIARIYFVAIDSLKNQKIFPSDQFTSETLDNQFLEYHLRGISTEKGLQTLQTFIQENNTND